MDTKLEARIAKLERIMNRKFEAAEEVKDDEKAWKEFDEIHKERILNELILDYMETDHEDGGRVFADMRDVAHNMQRIKSAAAEKLAAELERMADKAEKVYDAAMDKSAELTAKEEEMRIANGWTKTAVNARRRALRQSLSDFLK